MSWWPGNLLGWTTADVNLFICPGAMRVGGHAAAA